MPSKADWKERAKAAEAHAARLEMLIDDKVSFKDLEMHMRDGTWDLRAVLGDGSRPATRFLAGLMWHAILGDDDSDPGEEPPNYRATTTWPPDRATRIKFALTPALAGDVAFQRLRAEMELIKPGGKSSHELREELERRVRDLEAELAAARS